MTDIENGVYAAAKAGNIELFEYLVSYCKITTGRSNIDIYKCIISCAFDNSKIKMFNHLLRRKYDDIDDYEDQMKRVVRILFQCAISRKNMAFMYNIIALGRKPENKYKLYRMSEPHKHHKYIYWNYWNFRYEPIKRFKYLTNIGLNNYIYPNGNCLYTHGALKLNITMIIML
jgi:hypothetical protein